MKERKIKDRTFALRKDSQREQKTSVKSSFSNYGGGNGGSGIKLIKKKRRGGCARNNKDLI